MRTEPLILVAFVGGPLNGQHHWRLEAGDHLPHFLPDGRLVMYGALPPAWIGPCFVYAPVGMESAYLDEARTLRAPPPDPLTP
jgi:hypothetical protein